MPRLPSRATLCLCCLVFLPYCWCHFFPRYVTHTLSTQCKRKGGSKGVYTAPHAASFDALCVLTTAYHRVQSFFCSNLCYSGSSVGSEQTCYPLLFCRCSDPSPSSYHNLARVKVTQTQLPVFHLSTHQLQELMVDLLPNISLPLTGSVQRDNGRYSLHRSMVSVLWLIGIFERKDKNLYIFENVTNLTELHWHAVTIKTSS